MVAAYCVWQGRLCQLGTVVIIFGGWHLRYIFDYAGICRCHPVRITYVRIADLPRGRSCGLGTKTTTRVIAKINFNIRGGGVDRVTRYWGHGHAWGIPPR